MLVPEDYELQDPDTVPIKGEEAREQARLVAGLRKKWSLLPDVSRPMVISIPMGGSRNAVEGASLKTQGATAGSPDLCIILPDAGVIWLEMKAEDGVLSKSQREFHASIEALCHTVVVAYSAEDALAQLRKI